MKTASRYGNSSQAQASTLGGLSQDLIDLCDFWIKKTKKRK